MPSAGSWAENTKLKPQAILRILDVLGPQPFAMLDADAEIVSPPILFDSIPRDCALAVHYLDWATWYGHGTKKEILPGTLWVNGAHPRIREVITEWASQCHASVNDQPALDRAICETGVKVFELPVEYAWIATLPDGGTPTYKSSTSPVIIHHQASRTCKHDIRA